MAATEQHSAGEGQSAVFVDDGVVALQPQAPDASDRTLAVTKIQAPRPSPQSP